jgi:DNA-binding LytR/AlgR family response regulator
MKDIEQKLSSTEFVRAHRSYIIRIDKIASIDNHFVILEDLQKEIPVSATYREELIKRLNMI